MDTEELADHVRDARAEALVEIAECRYLRDEDFAAGRLSAWNEILDLLEGGEGDA